MLHNIPHQREICDILFNEERCKKWLIQSGIIWKARDCSDCGRVMLLDEDNERYRHYCVDGRREISMWRNTFFSRSKVKPNDTMNMIYMWIHGAGHTFLTGVGGHSTNFLTNLISELNQLAADNINDEKMLIGGEGVIVEIDESKLSKRKHNRGHHVDGVWVVGGVERTGERKMFAVQVENRNTESLQEVISTHVREGSIIHTDCWKAYGFLTDDPRFTHRKVNHSKNFKDPITGVHTNTIEGTWGALKSKISKRYRCSNGLGNHILSFIWRRQNEADLWNALIEALTDYEFIE